MSEFNVTPAIERMREQFLDMISWYSEDRWCAGWMSGIEEDVRRIGGIWDVVAEACGGWPIGYRAEGGWEPYDTTPPAP